jgi:GAF domain-containing protein/multidrug resistance efflux pump
MSAPATSTDELREEVERLRLLHAVGLELGASLDFDALVPTAFNRIVASVGAAGGSIWIAQGEVLRCRMAVGPRAERLIGSEVPIGHDFVEDEASPQTPIPGVTPDESRFEAGLDPATGAPGARTMAATMVASGVTIGAVEVRDKIGGGTFDSHDRELLDGLAAAAGLALGNAQLHASAKRAGDLAVLLDISREITATLDLDRVLQSVVNLAARALPFDRAAVALYEKGRCDVRAVAGEETVEPKDPKLQDLVARAEWAAGRGEPLYLAARTEPGSDAERMFITIFGPDLEGDRVESGLYLPLKDEEGVLGVLVFESASADFATPTQREVAAILANQTAVALRNAQLYHQVPMVDALGALAAKRQALRALPRRRLGIYAGVALVTLAALVLIRWPLRVVGSEAAFRPAGYAPVRAFVAGVVERIPVAEGTPVARGTPVAYLRATGLRADREAMAADAVSADRLAALAASRGDPSEERVQRLRGESLRREVGLLDEELELTTLRAPVSGIVLTPRPAERVGTSLEEGDELLAVGRTDSLELDFGVAQRDIERVRPGQEVRLRVDAAPQRTFVGRVLSVAPMPADTGAEVRYPVRAVVANPDGMLRPSMAAYVRVLTDPASAATRLLRGPVRWARLLWWRIWS